MAENTLKLRIKLRSKTSTEWEAIKDTDIPLEGEYCFVSDLNKAKMGNGVDTFYNLPWTSFNPAEIEAMREEITTEIENSQKSQLYSSDEATLKDFGGIPAGSTFENVNIVEVMDQLLHPYVVPVVTVFGTPDGGVYEVGSSVTVSDISINISKGSHDITAINVYNSQAADLVIGSLADATIADGGVFTIPVTTQTITSDTQFIVKVTDASGAEVTKYTGAYKFIYPMYYGAVSTSVAETQAAEITAMNKHLGVKGNKTVPFTTENNYPCFAYPQSYGELTKIYDANGFDVTNLFAKLSTTVEDTENWGGSVVYNVYQYMKAATLDNFEFTFQF